MFCPKCGTELDEDAKFCSNCGLMIDSGIKRSGREQIRVAKRKPLNTLAIVAIIIVVVVVITGLLSAVLLLGDGQLFGEVVGSGNLVTKEESFNDFTIVDAGSGFDVEITNSNSYNVIVMADDNVMEYIEVSKSGEVLKVRTRWGTSFRSVTLKIKITMPEINKIELSGGAQGKIEDFSSTNPFSIELSGGTQLTGKGSASNLTVDASGGSQLHFGDYLVRDVYVELSGGSQATVNLDGTLDADLSGGSQLYYYGDPTIGAIDIASGSQMHKK